MTQPLTALGQPNRATELTELRSEDTVATAAKQRLENKCMEKISCQYSFYIYE
jgi:hypothetical protein